MNIAKSLADADYYTVARAFSRAKRCGQPEAALSDHVVLYAIEIGRSLIATFSASCRIHGSRYFAAVHPASCSSRVKDRKVIGVANEDALEEACAQQSVEV